MDAIDVLFAHLKGEGFDVMRDGDTITYNKPYMKQDNVNIVSPRKIKVEGTKVTISGNMPEPIVVELCSPASISELLKQLDKPVEIPHHLMGDYNLFHGLLMASHTCEMSIGHTHIKKSPRSSEDRAPVSGTGDEGSSPSGGTK